jgi:negative regulator of flagellin synthesis FlgM
LQPISDQKALAALENVMTEKINGQGLRPTDTASTRRSEASKAARNESTAGADQSAPSGSSGDTVNITHSGLLMSRLQEIVQGAPVVDTERVAALKNAIASGSYEIDHQKIADKLLLLERNLRS